MQLVASTSIGEFRLKCTNCTHEMIYITGVKTLQLGDHPVGITCGICQRSDSIITIGTPTVINRNPTEPAVSSR